MDLTILFLIGLGFVTLVTLGLIKVRRRAFVAAYRFPPGLDKRLRLKFPERSDRDRREIIEGLRDWFCIAQDAGRRSLSMPSNAVDEAWHTFILDTRAYREFCRSALGRYYDHVPAEAMRSPRQAQDGIKRAWRLACGLEKIDRLHPDRLPRLFALDSRLAITGGYVYALNCSMTGDTYCASSIGCSSGCGGGSDGDGGDGGDGGCGGGGD
jgi:hypothetical protein